MRHGHHSTDSTDNDFFSRLMAAWRNSHGAEQFEAGLAQLSGLMRLFGRTP